MSDQQAREEPQAEPRAPQFSSREIERRVTSHPPRGPGDVEDHRAIRDAVRTMMHIVNDICPDGRDKALAFTALEVAGFHAHAALGRARDPEPV